MRRLIFLAQLLCFAFGDETTFISFSRRIQTCDSQDRAIEQATSRMIWSYNDNDPVDENSILKHDERGVTSVRFFNSGTQEPNLPNGSQALDIRLNNQKIRFDSPLAGPTTQYWCSGYKISDVFTEKRQVVRIEPIIDPRNVANVHHLLVYLCPFLNDTTDLQYQGGCYQQGVTAGLYTCNGGNVVTGWAVGGFPMTYPDHVGMPLEGKNVYLMMEIHYDNPKKLDITDSSGVRLWHTDQLRPNDAGALVLGTAVDPVITIPPGQSAYPVIAYCPEECTTNFIPPEGIKVFGVNLHTHLAGKQVFLRHYRNGTELLPLLLEPYFDFNFQETNRLPQEITVLPGDSFQVTCVYDTFSRPNATHMGLGTQEEMCRAQLSYYPKLSNLAAEHCTYANYTGIGPGTNQTITCAAGTITNWAGPFETIPYIDPPCVYAAPPSNNTIPVLAQSLNKTRYPNHVVMDPDGLYNLYWDVDKVNYILHAAIEVKTSGWVGFGVSPQGMEGADVLIAWVKDGQVYFKDRFAYQQALPPVDTLQDFFDISGGEYTTTSEAALTVQEIVGISVGGGFILIGLFLFVFCMKRKKTDLNTALTKERYGGVTSEGEDHVDPPSMLHNDKEPVAL